MNAVQPNQPPPGIRPAPAFPNRTVVNEPGTELSALIDGELDVHELDGWLHALGQEEALRVQCRDYRVISDVLSGGSPALRSEPPHAFVAGVRARLLAEPVSDTAPTPVAVQVPVRAAAANDAVFRWKMVAGVASLAAVMAVSWGVLGSAPSSSGGVQPGPQLALMPSVGGAPLAGPTQPVDPAATTVLVNTAQGPVLRDVRLEQLLAEHRQYGGMSALQMPAGFLRDATHPAEPQR